MQIKTKRRQVFGRILKSISILGAFFLVFTALSSGLYTETPGAIADSPMMEGATPSGGMSYGSLNTHIYRVNDGSSGAPCWNGGGCYTSHAMCLQPGKASHVGDYGYVGTESNQTIVKIMLVTDAAVNPTIYNAFRSTGMDLESLGSTITSAGAVNYGYGGSYTAGQARAFVVGHVLAGAVYSGTAGSYYAGLSGSAASSMTQAYNTIINWFNSNYSDAPPQYKLYTFYPNDSSHQTLGWISGSYTPTPVVQTGSIQLLKYDSATGYSAALNGTGVLSGATFKVHEQGSSSTLATRTTGSNGYTPSYTANAGKTICFTETTPPTGYVLDTTPKCATIVANSTVYVNMANTKQTGSIQLLKYDSATGYSAALSGTGVLSGATFRLYEQGNSSVTLATRTTASNGYTPTYTAEVGKTICFVETTPPTGYVLDTTPKCATITGSSTVTVNMANTKQVLHGGLRIRKVDADTNNGLPRGSASVQGTVFMVYNSNSSGTVGSSTGVTLTADATGYAEVAANVLSIDPINGNWYCVKETSAGTGYNLSDTSCKPFKLTTNGQVYDMTSTPFKDSIITGNLAITKQRSIFTEAANGWVNVPLSGVTFTLTNNSDASVVYTTGPTDANGAVTLSNIMYGTYSVVENRTASNSAYVLNNFTITISSQNQTVSKSVLNQLPDNPGIDTTARNSNSDPDDKHNVSPEDKEIEIDDAAAVTDYTTYSGLEGGASYRVEGELWKINPPRARVQVATQDFTAASSGTGSFDLHFDAFDSTEYIGETLGIVQKLYKKNSDEWLLLTIHNMDFSNTQETVTVANLSLSTRATDDMDGDKIIEPTRAQIIKDQVTYKNLVQGRDYVLVARLIDKEESKASGETRVVTINGREVPAIVTKITMPNAFEDTNTVRFNIDASSIPGKELVVYERVYEYVEGATASNWQEKLTDLVIGHEDINNAEQTVKVRPRIGTTAIDKSDSDHVIGAGVATIVDTVSLEGLSKENYKLIGYVVEKMGVSGGNTEDRPIVAPVPGGSAVAIKTEKSLDLRSASSIPSEIAMEFTFDTTGYLGKELVIYEELYRIEGGTQTLVAWHKDASEAKQTVKVATPRIGTTATDKEDGDKEIAKNEEVTIIDKVEYEGLVPENKYTFVGELRDKKTGAVIELKDGKAKVIRVFEAENTDGFEEMEFTIDTKEMAGKEVVVFEELYFGEWIEEEVDEETGDVITPAHELTEDEKIAEHKNLSDINQTVRVTPDKPDTGIYTKVEPEDSNALLYAMPVIVVAVCSGGWISYRAYKRRRFGW